MIRSLSRKLTVKTSSPSTRRERRNDKSAAAGGHRADADQTHWTALQSTTNLVRPTPAPAALSLERGGGYDEEKKAWDPSQPVPLSPIPIGPPPSSFTPPAQNTEPKRSTSLARKASRSIKRSLSRKPKPNALGHNHAHANGTGSPSHGHHHGGHGHLAGEMEGVAGTPEMVLDLGDVVDTIDLARLDTRAVAAGDDFDGFDRVRGMGGYTWLKPSTEQSQPSILVPGQPDVWDPPREKTHIRPSCAPPRRPDMIDYNALLHPLSSTEPMFHALADEAGADAPLPQLITDRANLLKLFAYVRDPSESHDFRVNLECIGAPATATIVMSRWEPASGMRASTSRTKAPAIMGLSYAPAWLEAVTRRSGCDTGAQPDREAGTFAMVQYRFGSTDMLVRFEVDAALPAVPRSVDLHSSTPALAIGATTLRVQPGNQPFPDQSALVALKLISAQAAPDWQAMYLSLAFAQVPRALVGRNDKGDISSYPVEDVALGEHPRMIAAAEDTAPTMAKLEALLRRVTDGARRAYAQQQSARRGGEAASGRLALLVRDGHMSLVRIKPAKAGASASGLSHAARERILRDQGTLLDTSAEVHADGPAPAPDPSPPSGNMSRSKSITQAIKNRF